MFVFETGLLYNQMGGKFSDGGFSAKVNLDYLSVPAFAKLNFMGNPDRTAFLKAGLMPSILLSQTAKLSNGSRTSSTNDVGAKSMDLPMVVGLGGAIPISLQNSLILQADYVRSLISINKESSDVRNEGFVVSAGMSFGID